MIVNSIKIELTDKIRIIDLFAGVGSLSISLQKAYKKNSIRMSVGRDDFLWNQCTSIAEEEEIFFNNWEEEAFGITPKRTYQVKIETSKNNRLTKAIITQKIVRFFREKGCPVRRDFIGRIEVWIEKQQDNESVSFKEYQRYTIRPRFNDQCDGWQLDIAEGRNSVVSTTPTKYYVDLPEEGYDVICNHCVIPVHKIEQRHWTVTDGLFYPVVSRSISKIVGINTYYKKETNKFASKLVAAQSFLDTWICTEEFKREVGVDFPNGN